MNQYGNSFRISIFGESHGNGVGITIDGCPPGIPFKEEDMHADLLRRKSGKKGTTPRIESDEPEILSGVFNGTTTGAPVAILFRNENTRSGDYSKLVEMPRPGHADLTAMQKYNGYNDYRGGGHFSGRITLGIVAAGVLAKKIMSGISFSSEILEIGGEKEYSEILEKAIREENSLGGIVEVKGTGIPAGLGDPFFYSFESAISHLVFSVPAVKGIEFGAGFQAARMTGSQNNDPIISSQGETSSNNSGGINGGISNGNELVFRVAVKPTASIGKPQTTMNLAKDKLDTLQIGGRHDACITLRTPVIFEACAAIAAADLYLMNKSIN